MIKQKKPRDKSVKFYDSISLRRVDFSDIEFLWYLRNQPEIYKYFKEACPVSWENHINWIIPIILKIKLKDVFIIQESKVSIGQIRFNYDDTDISISILKEFQTKGIASKAITLAIKEIKKKKIVKVITAEIDKNNTSSIKLFEKLGFTFTRKKGKWLKYIFNL
jgi:RimJ/RimL family protein N-acetyltransferase